MATALDYKHEYLGHTQHLVITPLTERCQRILLNAMVEGLGGCVQGPSGTGKSETVKDLAKMVAVQCVVFSCSADLTLRTATRLLMGLASTGAWSCLDEFNRLNLSLLSVIAQMILTIQVATRSKDDKVVLDGTNLRLINSVCVFITINPNFKGRAVMPDNLKALFRRVAISKPDAKRIAHVLLASSGYETAESLSL